MLKSYILEKITSQIQFTGRIKDNAIKRGAKRPGAATYKIIDRYQDLRFQAKDDDEKWIVWKEFCKDKGWDISHDAYDFFA